MSKVTIEWQTKQIELFYQYLRPSATSLLTLNIEGEKKQYAPEQPTLTNSSEEFVTKTLDNNKKGDCFAARNRFSIKRKTSNINFIKTWVIDIDNDIDDSISNKFERLCKKHNIYIEAKAKSRDKGGYHYYIPYGPLYIDDANRNDISQVGNNLKSWLVEDNKIDVDSKIFDLARLIRIWGTKNYKRESFCELLYLHTATKEQIEHNTKFINSLEAKKYPQLLTPINIVTSCPLIEYVRHNNLENINPEAFINDKLLKNVAIFLKSLYGEQGRPIADEICKMQHHAPTEMDGWWKRSSTDMNHFSCGEMHNFLIESFSWLLKQTCSKCRILNRNNVVYTDGEETWNQLKKQARENKYPKVLINKEVRLQGLVSPSVNSYKQEIVIFREFEKVEGDMEKGNIIVFFDEKLPDKRMWKQISSLNVDFYMYEFIENGTSFCLMSEEKLDYGEYFIYGSAVRLSDQVLVGNYGKITANRKMILLHHAKTIIQKITDEKELFKKTNQWTKKSFLDFLFSYYSKKKDKNFVYRQPDNISLLIMCFLFSTHDEYPLHVAIYGKQDSGKSTLINTTLNKFNESYILIDGGNTTLKGIVPSFGGKVPKIGVILESKRICAIDEFFRIIKSEEDNDKLSVLNNFLLHTKYSNKTGKGDIDCQMRSKLFVVTNPLYGCNFEETIKKLPPSTIDRILIWKQTEFHYNWINSGDNKVTSDVSIRKNDFIAVYDYMNSFLSEFDDKKIKLIVDEFKSKCPNYMLNLYETRYGNHHSLCLMDGIVKSRCLFDKDQSFKATEEDYQNFRKLWNDLVIGWYDKVSQEEGERLLSEEQNALFALIKEQKEIWDYKLEKVCEEKNIEFKNNYKRLLELKMIENNNRKITIVEEQELDFEDINLEVE